MSNEYNAYCEGWKACENGEDGRFTNPYAARTAPHAAWSTGFLDCMESEQGDTCNPETSGYTK